MQQYPYNLPFLPMNSNEDRWESLGYLEFEALAAITKLDGMMIASQKDLFWLTWLLKEAQSSNIIEGTVTTFIEILEENAGIAVPARRKDDILEVLNYRDAMREGVDKITQGWPLSLSFVKALHALLLQGARGENKNPGSFRRTQVHIGRPNSTLKEAVYIPPDPLHVDELLENWLAFTQRTDVNPAVQAAIMHAQFEMIHPFCDGNGRLGRLLITLFFAEKQIISVPCFYMSVYLQDHREEYYLALRNISRHGDWTGWIKFFLEAVIERCNDNMRVLGEMNRLHEQMSSELSLITGSLSAVRILNYMFAKPLFTIPDMTANAGAGLTPQGVTNVVKKMQQAGIVENLAPGSGKRAALWKFARLMDIIA